MEKQLEKIKYYFISKEESKEFLKENNLTGKYSVPDCDAKIKYNDENNESQIDYCSRKAVIEQILNKTNDNSIKCAKKKQESHEQYNEYVFISNNQKTTIIVPIENQELLAKDYTYKDHSIDEYTKILDNVVANTVKANWKKLFKRILAGIAIAGTIGGSMHLIVQQTKKNIEMQSQTNTYDKYYKGIVPERQFEDLVEGLQNDSESHSYVRGK